MPSTVRVVVHVSSDKRSKYAIVGAIPKKPNKFSDLANSEGHLRHNSILPSPRQSEYYFIPSRVNFLTKYCLRLGSKLNLKVEDFFEGAGIFFSS